MSIGTTSNMEWLVGNGGGGSAEYTGGHGITIDNVDHIISVDQSEIQDKLTAGEGITIQNNVISANPQRQSDWAQTDTDAVDYIRNKPTIPTATSDLTNDSNFITASDVPSAQVQSDWSESDSSDPAYIANKPTIPSGDQLVPSATSSDEGKILTVDSNGDPSWAPAQTYSQVQSNWNETDSSAVSYIQNKPTIPTATSDLTNDSNFITASDVPSSQVQSDWTESDTSDPAYIAHKPSIPTKTSDLTNDSNYITSSDVPGAQVQSDWTEADTSSPAYIANKPTIPTVDQSYSASSTNAQSGTAVAQAVSGVDAVPDVTSSDNGKVLVATYSGGTGSYAWASTPPANAIILTSSSTWSDFHTPYSAGRKDIYYKHTSPYSPFESRAELYLHLTAVSDVDGTSTNFTFALFEAAWESGGVDYTIRCKFRYSGNPMVHVNALVVEQSYSATSTRAQSGKAVAEAISAVNQVPSSTSADEGKVLTVDSNGDAAWATNSDSALNLVAGTNVTLTKNGNDLTVSASGGAQANWNETDTSAASYIQNKPSIPSGDQILPPASSSDDGKVLKVNSAGHPIWVSDSALNLVAGTNVTLTKNGNDLTVSASGGATYTAGNMIAIDPNNSNAISVSTTAGITDIQIVNALPASPVATVMYLIPAT